MAASKVSREDAIARIADVFRLYGYEGASLSTISKAAGLGRASLYHHFPGGKEEMAREALKAVGAQVVALLVAPLRASGTPRQRLDRWASGVDAVYDGGCKNCILGAMILSGGSDLFSRELHGTFKLLIESLRDLLQEAGIPDEEARKRAENAIGQIQGALLVSRGLGDVGHFQRVVRDLPARMLSKN